MTDTTTSEFLLHIENVIKMDIREKKTAEDTIYDLWGGFCDFYKCTLKKGENTASDLKLIEEIHDIIEHSYSENMEKSETLSEIQGLLMKHYQHRFNIKNDISKLQEM